MARIRHDQRMVAARQSGALHHQHIVLRAGDVGIHQDTAAAGQRIDGEGLEGAVGTWRENQTPPIEGQRVHGFYAVFHDTNATARVRHQSIGLCTAEEVDLAAVADRTVIGGSTVVNVLHTTADMGIGRHGTAQDAAFQILDA